ncbi:MAG: FAD-dependent oxidoreductase [Acidaminococcales bacterium]|nr:FAD-dependent oxidoreductase [Acidaminococcales bacterium]
MAKYLVVGGVAAGAAFAAKMRRLDENAEITVFERGPYVSYANCGLPYYIGGLIKDEDELVLHTPATLKGRFNVTVLVNTEVVAINRKQKTVTAKKLPGGELLNYPYDKLLLAPGSYAVRPPIAGAGLAEVFILKDVEGTAALKTFLNTRKPERAAVIGGGSIGLEAAENFCALGLKTALIEASGQVMPAFDPEMAAILQNHIRQKKVDLRLKTFLAGIEKKGGELVLRLSGERGGELKTDFVLLSMGIRPETALAEAAGLKIGKSGGIKTNRFMQTSDKDIYAAGDAVESTHMATGRPFIAALAGNAGKQARVAAAHIAGEKKPFGRVLASAAVKVFDLTAAATGANEKDLKAAGANYDKVYLHPASHAAYYPGGSPLSIKLLFAAGSGKILGAQVVGKSGADKRADVFAAALKSALTVRGLGELELAYAPPYASARDPVNYAGDVAAKVLSGELRQAFWQDAPPGGARFLLDVRTADECAGAPIKGALNIPLHELRERAGELPKDRTIYVFCHSGLRSYIACRALTQKGFDAVNMSGGYMSWRAMALEQGLMAK